MVISMRRLCCDDDYVFAYYLEGRYSAMVLVILLMLIIAYIGCVSLHVYITDEPKEKNHWNLFIGIGLLTTIFLKALQFVLK